MNATDTAPSIDPHFTGRAPFVRAVYDRILAAARELGPVHEEAKKTSIHLVNRTAFAGGTGKVYPEVARHPGLRQSYRSVGTAG